VSEPLADEEPTEADEADEGGDAAFDLFDPEDESAAPAPGWLGAVAQMIAALLVVVACVVLFIGVAVALRWLLP
jgi:hypothetical protein